MKKHPECDPLVNFTVNDDAETELEWTFAEQMTIMSSAAMVDFALMRDGTTFLEVYHGQVTFHKTGQTCEAATTFAGCWGRSTGRNSVEVFTDIVNANGLNQLIGDVHWAIHELGHSFVSAVGSSLPIDMLTIVQSWAPLTNFPDRPLTPNDPDGKWGFAGPRWGWQRSDQGRASEEFADMYLGWVYNEWETTVGGGWSKAGQMRADFMNTYMSMWVNMGD